MSTELLSMSDEGLSRAYALQSTMEKMPQVDIEITHSLHAGVYTRTAFVPAGCLVMGVLIKLPTTVIVSGHALIYIGDETREVQGYQVIDAQAHRKQAALAIQDTYFSMLFRTEAKTIEEAENEFTDESEQLTTRRPLIQNNTGAHLCLE